MAESAEIWVKIYRYCAYQERCRSEVCQKLSDLEADPETWESILAHLEPEKFLDEARFTRMFTGGKFFHKQWGRQKIRAHLQSKQVPAALIDAAFRSEIDPEVYLDAVLTLISKHGGADHTPLDLKGKDKLGRMLAQKGYEWDIIREGIRKWEEETR